MTEENWRIRGMCRNDPNPDRWFPEGGVSLKVIDPELVAICNSCPVAAQCTAFAENNPVYGVWGGKRYGLARTRLADEALFTETKPLKPCGTAAAYRRHARANGGAGEFCETCERIKAENRKTPIYA